MPVFLTYPDSENLKRADGANCVVVEAADAASVAQAARQLVRNSNENDFIGWKTMQISATAHSDFRPFVAQGSGVVGRSPLPQLGRGGDPVVTP